MSEPITVSSIREKFPMYDDMSDEALLGAVRKKFYADIPMNDFVKRIDFDTERAKLDPTNDMSTTKRAVAGYGKAAADTGRGASQLLRMLGPQYAASADYFGLPGQSDVNEAKRLDAPLMRTGAGMGGNIAGNVANALPTVAFGGGLPAAAMTGAAMGGMQPVADDESRLANVAIGGAAGAGGNLLGRGIGAAYHGGISLLSPFTQVGRERIAGRMLNRFADNPGGIAGAKSAPTLTGARPTLAEQTGDVGIARLQDSLRAADPQFNNQIAGRLTENNAARVDSLLNLTGQGGARDAAATTRAVAGEKLYGDAFRATSPLSPSQLKAQANLLKSGRIDALLGTPAIADARKAAQTIAANKGVPMDDPAGSIEGLHYMKLAMDDAVSAAKSKGTAAGANLANSIEQAQRRLVTAMETLSPDYKSARTTYAQMSGPINAMDIAAEVAKRGLSKGSDLSGSQTINRNALLGALQDEPALIKSATGRTAGKSLADVMQPDQLAMLRAVASESDRAGAVAAAGNGPGSATAQRMASQNVLRQIMGPLGLPQSWSDNALANTLVGKPLNLIYGGVAEPRIQQELARAILDPDSARAVLAAAKAQGVKLPPSTMLELTMAASRATAPALAISGQR